MRSIAAAFTLFLAVNAVAEVASDAEIRKMLVERVDQQKRAVGIVVGVIDPSGRRVLSHGALTGNDKKPPNGDTLFEIGSVTKVFTSLLLADAVQRGEVKLDDPVSEYLPADVKMPERGRAITLRDLATHTSGLPRLPTNIAPKDESNPYADYTVKQMYEFLSSYELPRDAGETYEYSNFGAGLLGHVLARRAGVEYEQLVRTRITNPLGMKSTGIRLTDALQKRLAPGHDEERKPAKNWDIPTLAGAGALRSSANDLLNFLAAVLRYSTTPVTPAMTSMLATKHATQVPAMNIALGWHVTTGTDGREIVWHNGGTGGYRSFVGFDPKTREGVVVLTNTFTNEGIDDIGRRILSPRSETTVDEKVLDRYAGTYELAPSFVLVVTREGNQLFAQATGQPKFPLFAANEKEFFYKVVDARITFENEGLVLHQNGAQMPGKRVQSHPAAPKERKEIAIDPAILGRYAGRYQLAPAFILTITREGDKLFVQASGQPKIEMFAESERDFFLKAVDAQLTFVVDATGRATKVILHQNARDQEAARIE
jgi:serine-type D-Ala-D-Ala carboxypeptidase/endopeptidase